MTSGTRRVPHGWFWAGVVLTLLKLWLTRGQPVFAIGPAGHDDRLFLQLAEYLVRGEWLGPYDQMTLAKGPFYSFWIATTYLLGVPLFLSQQLLYAVACALIVRAWSPAVRSAAALFALYALLLWNPMTFEASSLGRVLRQHVYTPLVLLIFASLIALYFRRQASLFRLLPWAILLGLAGAGFWLTREESIWLAPSVALLAGASLLTTWYSSRPALLNVARAFGVAVFVAVVPVFVVSALNYRAYRWFGTVEFRAPAFNDAYGAMVRVRVGPDLPFVPVTREAREAMYVVSPAFAELKPYLEGDLGRGWADASSGVTGLAAEQRQIGGGWYMWALRDAVVAAGHGHNAGEALAYYRRMAGEINAACESGRLRAGPPRSGFLPVWRDGQTEKVANTFVDFADFVVSFSNFTAFAPPSAGGADSLELFSKMTHEQLSPSDDIPRRGDELEANNPRTRTLHSIGKVLRQVLLVVFFVAQFVAVVRVVQCVKQKQWTFALTIAAAAWGACAASLLIHAIIHVTSFNVLVISSFAQVYPLVLLFAGAAFIDATQAWRTERVGSPRPAAAQAPTPRLLTTPEIPLSPRLGAALPWVVGALALLPFVIWQGEFAKLTWFGDDYFLVDQLSQMGFWAWTWRMFTESFVPLFKALWGGGLLLFDGSYQAMLWLLWLTHALNTVWFGRLLRRAEFGWLATAVAQLVFALAPANLETLGWSVQWSAVLATSFLLAGMLWHEKHIETTDRLSLRVHGPLVLFAAASASCFARGVLTGGVLALALLSPVLIGGLRALRWPRYAGAVLCLLPAISVALLITKFAGGNHQHMGGHWIDALKFATGFFLINPGYLLCGAPEWSPGWLALVFGSAKLALIYWGLSRTEGRRRGLLWLLLAYDLGNAALLGLGRYHTGFEASLSSRYNYSSLLATLPFLGLLANHVIARALPTARARVAIAGVVVTGLVLGCLVTWPSELAPFVRWRGTELRELIQAPATNDPAARVPALDLMHIERAKALTRAYNLH